MNFDQQLAELDQASKDAKRLKEVGEALGRLRNNRDFQKIILTGYLKDEAVRLVHFKGSQGAQDPVTQACVIRDLDAIGSLAQYFNMIDVRASQGTKQIGQIDEMRQELLDEQLAEAGAANGGDQ